jgi:hypothetical protein
MRQADRHATGPQALSPLLTGTLALVALATVAGAAAQAGAAIDHWRHRPPVDPLALALELADGRTRWPPAGTPLLIAAAGACALIVTAFVVARARRRSAGTGADRAARLLAGRSKSSPTVLCRENISPTRPRRAASAAPRRARGSPQSTRGQTPRRARALGRSRSSEADRTAPACRGGARRGPAKRRRGSSPRDRSVDGRAGC